MPRIVETEEAISVVSSPMGVIFFKEGDRWRHRIEIDGRCIASTVEGEPGRDDPARIVSPTYQEVSVGERPSGARALLVGQSGRHHCSAVLDVFEENSETVIDADLAVRSSQDLRTLGSTYSVSLSSAQLIEATPGRVVWELSLPEPSRLVLETSSDTPVPARIGLAESGRNATLVQVYKDCDPSSKTQRLRYRWSWSR